ncbi:MAG: DeoR/GlpR family DNA-binding transcription regulator [Tissierellia bacterium]|nr:DeoR/GlpR family DNA-binding transcription regulator [Tissierellia bacterium]
MNSTDRQAYIIEKITNDGSVRVSDLSAELGVSEVTVRKDLKILEDREFLKRNFGGAISLKEHVKALSLEEKKIDNIELKKIIAKKASKLIKDGMDIFLDAGTTTFAMIEELIKFKKLTIITYDMNIAMELAKYNNIVTYLLGGAIEAETMCLLGIEGYKQVEKLHADICFIGTDAFDERFVYSTNNMKAEIKSKMLENSKLKILVCDSSKYPKDGLHVFYKLTDFNYIITDKQNEELNKLIYE